MVRTRTFQSTTDGDQNYNDGHYHRDQASARSPSGNEDYGAGPLDANADGSISDARQVVPHKKSMGPIIIGLDSSDSWIDVFEEFAFERMNFAG